MHDQVVVRCKDLRKTYEGKVEAVRGLDVTIYAGQCFGLLGPNGAGKTTTIEILEGLLAPTSGEVEILGHTWKHDSRALREMIGISLQETRLSEKLTVRETVELFAGFYKQSRPVDQVLAELSLTEKADARVGKLSGGQKQRLAIATALVSSPRMLFLDEPTTGLDPQSRREVWDIVRRFQQSGGTVLLTTHYMDEAERLCDYISIIDHGKVIADGTPAELISGVGGHHRVEFALEAENLDGVDLWRSLPGVGGVHHDAGITALTVEEPHLTIPALLATVNQRGWKLSQLTTRQSSLEDVFVNLTGRHLRED
jgi:ABC-2 type transport system ATP-binding protein